MWIESSLITNAPGWPLVMTVYTFLDSVAGLPVVD